MGYLDETGLSRVWNRIKAYIQSLNYTSNIGTVTGITMNNTSYSPIDGDVDIGTVVTDVSDKADDADVVHIEGAEDITGVKTFVGNKTVKFKQSSNSDKIGFTCYNKSDVEFGNFEVLPQDRAINLGIYNITSTPANDFLVGFKVQAKDSTGVLHKFGLRAPSRLGDSTYAEYYIPVIINNKEADNTGVITLSASDVGALPSSTVIPDAQIQSDWNQTTTTALDYIKNKPTIPTVPTNLSSFTDDLGSSPTHTHSQYLTSETEPDFNGSAAATITSADITAWNGKSTFSGSYNDLTDKPTLFSGAYADLTGKPNLATVATSGDYDDLSNKPTIPSAVTESTVSGWGFTKNAGTITGITMNGASKGTSGVVDLGTVITEHQSLTNYVQKNNTSGLLKNDGTVDTNTYLTTETEPAYTQSAAATLTSSNIVKGASQSYTIWSGTQQEYDAITTKDNNTIYFIKES